MTILNSSKRRLGIEINRRDNHFKLTGRPLRDGDEDKLRSSHVDTAPMRPNSGYRTGTNSSGDRKKRGCWNRRGKRA